MSGNGVEVIPSAKRLIRSLRDMGYEFAAAVADLVDNSIAARANTVRIDVVWDGEDSYVHIADNGSGMTAADLREALRFGSDREYDTEDLGKFGLGLKTASTSQCIRLTVASRQNTSRADINAYCWDLDHIEATNRWEILPVRSADLHDGVRQHLKETTGTVVIWERLDRVLGYKKPDGESARKQLNAMCRELEEHLAMVFHRFLAGEVRGRKLAIYLNNNKVTPWDPFARSESGTQKLEAVVLRLEGENGRSDVIVEPFVLPPQSKFSNADAFNRASGPNKWNRQQGFYIYRADRMIQRVGGAICGRWTSTTSLPASHFRSVPGRMTTSRSTCRRCAFPCLRTSGTTSRRPSGRSSNSPMRPTALASVGGSHLLCPRQPRLQSRPHPVAVPRQLRRRRLRRRAGEMARKTRGWWSAPARTARRSPKVESTSITLGSCWRGLPSQTNCL